MEWSTIKKINFIGTCILVAVPVLLYIGYNATYKAPSCYDNKHNGGELGVDCGGSCALVCRGDVSPVVALESAVVPSGVGKFDITSLIYNPNLDSSPKEQVYTLKVIGDSGDELYTAAGTMSFPAGEKTPLAMLDVSISGNPKTVLVSIDNSTSTKFYKSTPYTGVPKVRVVNAYYDDARAPSVYATIQNQTYDTIPQSNFVVYLYDESDNIIGINKVSAFDLKSEEERAITFVWRNKPSVSPSRVVVLPVNTAVLP